MVDETTAAETTETAVVADAEDEFSKAFAQFAAPGEKPAATETASTPEPEAQQPPPADATEGVEAAPESEPETVVAEGETTRNEPVRDAPEPPRYTVEEWTRFMAAQQAAQQQQAPDVQPAPAAQQAPAQPVLSKEEIETVQEFRKEWPDVAKALDVQQKAFAHDLLNYVFSQIAQEVTPVLQQVETIADRTHVADIYDFVPDYDQVREPVIDWVSRLPNNAFRQYAVGVVQQGSPADIQGLVDQWRMFNGVAAPQAAAPAARAPQQVQRPAPVVKQAPPSLKQAAAAMAPVKSQRTTVIQTDDPNDFDGAFERYADEMRRQRQTFAQRQ